MRIQRWSSETEAPVANDNQETTYVGRRTLIEGQVRRKGSGEAAEGAATLVQRAQGSGGVALPEGLRGRFEQSLGADLGGVRVHTGAASAEAAASVGARAYALGQDVHFGAGEYTPGTSSGDQLIAHEVAHTVQQGDSVGGGAQFALEVSQPGDAFETEADRAAASMVAGQPAEVSRGSAGVARAILQRSAPASETAAPAQATGAGAEATPAGEGAAAQGQGGVLSPATRQLLAQQTAVFAAKAYAMYADDCQLLNVELEKAAKSNAEWLALMVDVGMGFYIPFMGKSIIGAIEKLGLESGAATFVKGVLTDNDIAKAIFTGATKTSCQKIKDESKALFGVMPAQQILGILLAGMDSWTDELITTAHQLPEDQLVALWGVLQRVEPGSYKAELSKLVTKYTNQVDKQSLTRFAVRVRSPGSPTGHNYLAIITATVIPPLLLTSAGIIKTFIEWVSPEMMQMAEDETRKVTGADPVYMSPSDIWGMPDFESEPPPDQDGEQPPGP